MGSTHAVDEGGRPATDTLALLDLSEWPGSLESMALAADPDAPLAPDAVPLGTYLAEIGVASSCGCGLPAWYMPTAPVRRGRGRLLRAVVVLVIVSAFVLIGAFGLCNSYGLLGFA